MLLKLIITVHSSIRDSALNKKMLQMDISWILVTITVENGILLKLMVKYLAQHSLVGLLLPLVDISSRIKFILVLLVVPQIKD